MKGIPEKRRCGERNRERDVRNQKLYLFNGEIVKERG